MWKPLDLNNTDLSQISILITSFLNLWHKDEPRSGQTLAPHMSLMVSQKVSLPGYFQPFSQVPSSCCCLCSLSQEAQYVEEAQTLSSV